MSYEALRKEICEKRPDIDITELDKAYQFAQKAHEGQTRFSGEPYINHLVESVRILMALEPDISALQACFLYDILERTDVKKEKIAAEFGEPMLKLLESMKNMSIVKLRMEDINTEKWKGLFLAMAKDVRVLFVKLSTRLHNMRTLEFVPTEKRERIARETLLLHAAVASRLGIYEIKSELEDLCFRFLYPQQYKKLSEQLSKQREKNEEYMSFAIGKIKELLKAEDIKFIEVKGRMKHLWSIYQKMLAKNDFELSNVYDLFAVRVILPDLSKNNKEDSSHIYSTLGILHASYVPLQDRFKDYIALPKPNGYRSLHTTVLGLGHELYSEPTEMQIRTAAMNSECEFGIASHWSYKEKVRGEKEKKQMEWLRRLGEENTGEIDLFPDKIFVLTPKGDVVEMPKGATPLDFAYMIHSAVGDKTVSTKVNGKIVPLDYELKNGEMVEIVTRQNAKPSRYWLSIAKTTQARSKIKNYFNKQNVEENIRLGRELINRELENLKKDKLDEKLSLLKDYGGKPRTLAEREDILESVGIGSVSASHIVHTIFYVESLEKEEESQIVSELTGEVLISGEERLPFVFSSCCKPHPPFAIIGYVTRGHSIRIHRQSCKELSGLDGERFVSAHWA